MGTLPNETYDPGKLGRNENFNLSEVEAGKIYSQYRIGEIGISFEDFKSYIHNNLAIGQEIKSGKDFTSTLLVAKRGNRGGIGVKEMSGGIGDNKGAFVSNAAILEYVVKVQQIEKGLADEVAELLKNNLLSLTDQHFLSLAQLRKMGHPYAKRNFGARGGRTKNTSASLPPTYYVNYQGKNPSEVLSASFNIKEISTGDGGYSISALNATPQAGYLANGTTQGSRGGAMVMRPYGNQAMMLTRQQVASDMEKAATALRKIGAAPQLALGMKVDFEFGDETSVWKRSYGIQR